MEDKMQAAKKGVLDVFYGIIGQLITIALGIVIPRLVLISYGSEVNGLLNSVTQIFAYFSLLEAGVGVASLQALYVPVATDDRKAVNGIIAATHHFYRKAGTLYGIAVIGLAFIYPLYVHSNISYWMVVGIILFGGFSNCINFFYQGKYKILMQAEGYSYICTNITTVVNIITNVVKVILLLRGYNVLVVQFAFFLIGILQMLIYAAYIRKHYAWVDLNEEPDDVAISQKGATLVHQVSGLIFNNTDVLALTVLTRDLKIVSIYTMYNMVITMATAMIQQIEAGFSFKLGQIYNTDKKQYLVLHHIFEIVYLILIFSVMTCIYIFLLPFIRLYTAGVSDINYINKWYPIFFILTPLLTYGRTAASNVISYAGHFKETQNRAILEAAINIVVSVIGIWKWGIFGALLGTIAASLYRTNDMILYAYKYLLEQKSWKTYKRWIACFVVFGIIVAAINIDNPHYDSYVQIVIWGAVWAIGCMAVYTLVQYIINPKEFKELFLIIKTFWKNRTRK